MISSWKNKKIQNVKINVFFGNEEHTYVKLISGKQIKILASAEVKLDQDVLNVWFSKHIYDDPQFDPFWTFGKFGWGWLQLNHFSTISFTNIDQRSATFYGICHTKYIIL